MSNNKPMPDFPLDSILPGQFMFYGTHFAETVDFNDKDIVMGFNLDHIKMTEGVSKVFAPVTKDFFNPRQEEKPSFQILFDDNFFNSMSYMLFNRTSDFTKRINEAIEWIDPNKVLTLMCNPHVDVPCPAREKRYPKLHFLHETPEFQKIIKYFNTDGVKSVLPNLGEVWGPNKTMDAHYSFSQLKWERGFPG